MVVHWPQRHLGLLLGIEKIWPIADWRVPSGDPRKHCGTHLGSNPFLFVKWRIRGSIPSTTPRLLPFHLPQCPCRCFMRLKPVRSSGLLGDDIYLSNGSVTRPKHSINFNSFLFESQKRHFQPLRLAFRNTSRTYSKAAEYLRRPSICISTTSLGIVRFVRCN